MVVDQKVNTNTGGTQTMVMVKDRFEKLTKNTNQFEP